MASLTKVHRVEVADDTSLHLVFSDGSGGVYDFAAYMSRDDGLTAALRDHDYFRKVFLDDGAVAWPNGLDFSGWKLQRDLAASGRLKRRRLATSHAGCGI